MGLLVELLRLLRLWIDESTVSHRHVSTCLRSALRRTEHTSRVCLGTTIGILHRAFRCLIVCSPAIMRSAMMSFPGRCGWA